MRLVRIAELGIVGLVVVVARRQTESALERVRDLRRCVLEIGQRGDREHIGASARGAVGQPGDDVRGRLQAVDSREVGLDRLVAGFLDGRFVHARAIEPADLLLDRAGLGLIGVLRRFLGDFVLRFEAVLAQLVERAPARAVGRNRILRDPDRVDVTVEVGAGIDGLVDFAHVERARGERAAGRKRDRNGGGQRVQELAGHETLSSKNVVIQKNDYQMTTRWSCDRAIGCGGAQVNALANSGRLLTGPLTRNFAGACSFDCTCRRNASGLCWCASSARTKGRSAVPA